VDAAIVRSRGEGLDGSSFAAVQLWIHDFKVFGAMSSHDQDNAIGRRKSLLQRLIRERPLGALVTLTAQGLNADHIPFEIDPEPEPLGTLRAHVARKQLAALVGIEIALSKLIGK
jgi:deferrochelatase/peroxidase EfeB